VTRSTSINQILQICTGLEYFETASQDQRLKHRAHIVCRDAVHNPLGPARARKVVASRKGALMIDEVAGNERLHS